MIFSENIFPSFKLPKMWYGSVEKAKGALIAITVFDSEIPQQSEEFKYFNQDVDNCQTFEDITKCFDKYFGERYKQ